VKNRFLKNKKLNSDIETDNYGDLLPLASEMPKAYKTEKYLKARVY